MLTVPHRGRSFNWIALRVRGLGPSSAVLDVRNVVASVEVLINDKPVSTYLPKLGQQYVAYLNQNEDTPAVDIMLIPFESPGVANRRGKTSRRRRRATAPRTSSPSTIGARWWLDLL